MKKILVAFIGSILAVSGISGCSSDFSSNINETDSALTIEDQLANEKGILSADDAEALIYNELNAEEKQTVTVDYTKKDGTKYYIRTYEKVDGEIIVDKEFTVDFHTQEVKQIK